MCGIAGFSRKFPSSIADGRKLGRELAYAIESRGQDATGFGWFAGETPMYWKAPGSAYTQARLAPLPLHLRTLIVHTRAATLGSPKVNDNNHPVVAPGIVLVHNGMIYNDDDLIDSVGHVRVGEVDSEALAALLSLGARELGAEHPVDLLTEVEGSAAIAWLDSDGPEHLHLARLSERPLAIGYTRRGDLLFASTPVALKRCATFLKVELRSVETIPEGTYLEVTGGKVIDRRRFKVRKYIAPYRHFATTSAGRLPSTVGADGIDWANLIPRRGWAENDRRTTTTKGHRWSTKHQRWMNAHEMKGG